MSALEPNGNPTGTQRGFRLVDHLVSGLERLMVDKGFERTSDFVGKTVPAIGDWGELDLGYKVVAEIDQARCVHCGLCYAACEDGAHQSIVRTAVPDEEVAASTGAHFETSGKRRFMAGAGGGYVNRYEADQETCVGCNLCSLVCPVDGCVSMVARESGLPSMTWGEYQVRLEKGEVEAILFPRHR